MSSANQKAARGSLWQIVNMGLFALQNFVFLMIMARYVPKEHHAVFALANILVVFITMVAESGTSAALIQRKQFTPTHLSIAFYMNVSISILLYGLLFASANQIVAFYEYKFSAQILYFIGLNLVISNIGMVSYSLLIKELDFKTLCLIKNFSYFVTHIALGICLAFFGFEVWTFIIPAVTFKFCTSVSLYIARPHSLKWRFNKKEFKDISYFGLSYTLVRVTHYFGFQLDKILLGKLVPLGDFADYEKGQTLSYLPGKTLGNAFDPVLFSVMTTLRGDQTRVTKMLGNLSSLLVTIMFYVSTVLFFCTESMVLLILGDNWLDATLIVKIFAVVIPFQIFTRISDVIIRSFNKMFQVLPIKIFYAAVVGLSAFAAYYHGVTTFTYAIAIGFILFSILMTTLAIKVSEIDFWTYVSYLKPAFLLLPVLIVKLLVLDFLYRQSGMSLIYEAPIIVGIDIFIVGLATIIHPPLISRFIDLDLIKRIIAK